MIGAMDFVFLRTVLGADFSSRFSGAWQRMSYRLITQTIGKAQIIVRGLAALSACLLSFAYIIPYTHGAIRDVAHFSRLCEVGSSSIHEVINLVVLPCTIRGDHTTL